MKRSRYLAEITKRVGSNGEVTCEDCGRKSMVVHGVINHDKNTVRVVCDECYQGTYHEWLYGNGRKH
jgi:uncharacterized Zn finger protein